MDTQYRNDSTDAFGPVPDNAALLQSLTTDAALNVARSIDDYQRVQTTLKHTVQGLMDQKNELHAVVDEYVARMILG